MTRYLADALEAKEPDFRHALMDLERQNLHPDADIRLTSDIAISLRNKLMQLGLDPSDTTTEELFLALKHKLSSDDKKLQSYIRLEAAKQINAEANIMDGLTLVLNKLSADFSCFILKPSVLKKQLQKSPPNKALKALGYRSIASMLKREPLALITLAINSFESSRYVKNYYASFKNYKSTDFESHKLTILSPNSKKWQSLLTKLKAKTGYDFISCYELGSLIILPLDNQLPSGQLTSTVVSILSELSHILTTSSFLRFNQVNQDFGQKLFEVAEHEPIVEDHMLNRPIPWHLVQSVLGSQYADFEAPHILAEELSFIEMADKLGDLVDDFKFWRSSEFLALVDKAEATSLNILDVAASLTRELDYKQRQLTNFKQELWHELMRRYISPEIINRSLKFDAQPEYAIETA